jgi:hypothetical protein
VRVFAAGKRKGSPLRRMRTGDVLWVITGAISITLSALPSKADSRDGKTDVCFGPKVDNFFLDTQAVSSY